MPTDEQQTTTPAGWYPDGVEASRLRWWDGLAWTEHLSPSSSPIVALPAAAQSTVDPPAALQSRDDDLQLQLQLQPQPGESGRTPQPLTRRQLRERGESLFASDATVELDKREDAQSNGKDAQRAEPEGRNQPEPVRQEPLPQSSVGQGAPERAAYVPMARIPREQYALTPRRGSSQNLSMWLFALAPLWQGSATFPLRLLGWVPNTEWAFLATGLVALFLTFGLATNDQARLRDRGYPKTASPVWVLVPLVYFIIRTVRVGWRGLGPLIAYVLAQVALIALAATIVLGMLAGQVAHSPASPSANSTQAHAPLTDNERAAYLTPVGMADKFRADLQQVGQNVSAVECLPLPSTDAGAATTCTVTVDNTNLVYRIRVSPEEPFTAFTITGIVDDVGTA